MITTRERTLAACLMAVSNMGMQIDEQRLTNMVLSYAKGQTTNDLIIIIAAPYLEDSNAETAFFEEACGWFITLKDMGWDRINTIWPHHTRYFNLIKNTDPSRQT